MRIQVNNSDQEQTAKHKAESSTSSPCVLQGQVPAQSLAHVISVPLTSHCTLLLKHNFRSLVFVSLKHSFYLHFYYKKKVDNHGQDATAKHKAQSQTPSSVKLHHDQETTERNKAESSSSSIVAGGSVAANSVAKSSSAPTPTQGIFALISCSFLVPKFADFYVYLLCEYKSTILIRSRRRSTRPSHQHRLHAFFKAKFPLKVWRMLSACHLHLTVHCCLSIIFEALFLFL